MWGLEINHKNEKILKYFLVVINLMFAQEKQMHHMSITDITFHTVFVFEQKSNQQHDKKNTSAVSL